MGAHDSQERYEPVRPHPANLLVSTAAAVAVMIGPGAGTASQETDPRTQATLAQVDLLTEEVRVALPWIAGGEPPTSPFYEDAAHLFSITKGLEAQLNKVNFERPVLGEQDETLIQKQFDPTQVSPKTRQNNLSAFKQRLARRLQEMAPLLRTSPQPAARQLADLCEVSSQRLLKPAPQLTMRV